MELSSYMVKYHGMLSDKFCLLTSQEYSSLQPDTKDDILWGHHMVYIELQAKALLTHFQKLECMPRIKFQN